MIVSPDATPVAPTAAPGGGHGVKVGIFDSGLGGLSVLRALRRALPLADLVYVADSAHAPYGERDVPFIIERCERITEFLTHGQSADVIVVACNTATAAAVDHIRRQWPGLPVVGVEPAVKPAAQCSVNRRVGVLATPGTLASARFRDLVAAHGQGVQFVLQPCPGLAAEIEKGDLDGEPVRTLVQRFSQPLSNAGVDTVVLGCTHYPFVAHLFQAELGDGVRLLDTADAVARQAARVIATLPAPLPASPVGSGGTLTSSGSLAGTPLTTGVTNSPGACASLHLWTSGDPRALQRVAHHWLHLDCPVSKLD